MKLKRFLSIAACMLLTTGTHVWAEGNYTSLNNKIPGYIVEKINNKQQLTNLPTIYLTVPDAINADGTIQNINDVLFKINNQAEYHTATIQVVDKTGKLAEFTDDLQIKVRGNSTAGDSKKPYRLKFGKDVKDAAGNVIESHKHDMLGLGYKKRNWTLLTNHKDKTLLHNALTYHIGQAVGMPFCPGYQFVDLVINGEYRGNYQISDHCEVGKNRIDVDEETGWFIEAARQDMVEAPSVQVAGLGITIKNPEPADEAGMTALKTEITSYFNQLNHFWGIYSTPCSMEDFVNPKTGWRAYMDEESFVNFYVGINLTDDYDGFMTVKMYREVDGKLQFGPLWDKDLAYGNWQNHGKLCEEYQPDYTFCDHVARMMTDPYLVKKIHDKLHAVVDAGFVADMKTNIQSMGDLIKESQALNQKLWYTCDNYPAARKEFADYIEEHTAFFVGAIDKKYQDMGCADLPDFPVDVPIGDLGALLELDKGKYSFTGSSEIFKEGTVITITSSATSLSNYITEGASWNTDKTITLNADDVQALAANKFTFYMVANGGEVTAVNVKAPQTAASGLVFVGQDNSNNIYTYKFKKSDVKTGAQVRFRLDGEGNSFWAKIYTTNPWTFDVGIWSGQREYTWKLSDKDVDNIVANNYSIKIVAEGCTCTSVEVLGSSSEEDEPTRFSLALTAGEGGTVSGAGSYEEGTTVLIKAIANNGYKFEKWSDDNTHAVRSVTLDDNLSLDAIFVTDNTPAPHQQLTNLPTIYLTGTVGNEWKPASLEVFDSGNKLYQGTEWTTEAVEVQFQGSGDKNKDSYRLKFADKTKLLSSGKFKQWVLLANDDDPSLMRNALAKELGDALGLPFTPGYQFVDLYVNDTYMGTYQVTDRVKAETGRALVSGGNKDLDWHVRLNDKGEFDEDEPEYYIAGTEAMPYTIPKNPDPKDDNATTWNSSLKDEMTTYFESLFAKDQSGHFTAFADGVDKQQLIRWYIAQEVLCVYKGFSSIEAYRSVTSTSDQKLHLGVIWDSEKSLGNTGLAPAINMEDKETKDSYIGLMTKYAAYDVMKSIFTDLWREPWFANGVNNLWSETHESLLTLLNDKANALAIELAESQAKDAAKWSNNNEYAQAVGSITSWLNSRFAYLTVKFDALAAALPCTMHNFTTDAYAKMDDGTYRRTCSNCGTAETEGDAYYHFIVYVEAKTKTETYTTEREWFSKQDVSEKPNTLFVTEAEGIKGRNVVSAGYCEELVIKDGHPFYYKEGDNFYAAKATYSRTINASTSWGTVCLPFKLADNDDVKLYALAEVDVDSQEGTMTFKSAEKRGALTPLAFRKLKSGATEVTFTGEAQANGYVTVKPTQGMSDNYSKEIVEGWNFYGNIYEPKEKDASNDPNMYYISGDKFWHATGTLTINPFRAYFSGTSTIAASRFRINADDAEGIEQVVEPNAPSTIYDLNGRQIRLEESESLKPGIYVVNGEKLLIE